MTSSIQHATFSDGGFVLHKVTSADYAGRFSAWFNRSGQLLDAEQITPRGAGEVSRTVKRGTPAAQMLAAVGARYVVAA